MPARRCKQVKARAVVGCVLFAAAVGEVAASPVGAAVTRFEFCLADICIGYSEQSIIAKYGPGHPDQAERPIQRCYQLKPKAIFVTVIIDDEDPRRPVTGVLATTEPNCPAAESASITLDLAACGPIRLGDPLDKVLGLGVKQVSAEAKGYPWYGTKSDVSQFDYRCQPEKECSPMSSVYVRAQRVIGIAVWSPDC
jgi:hypothetical protein